MLKYSRQKLFRLWGALRPKPSVSCRILIQLINTLRPRQNRRHFADGFFKCIFLNENVWIPVKLSLKYVPKSPFNNIPALVQIMAWRRSGDKPLSEPMMVGLSTHICVTRPQWIKPAGPDISYPYFRSAAVDFNIDISWQSRSQLWFPHGSIHESAHNAFGMYMRRTAKPAWQRQGKGT